jgi:signal transduction histidine kinase
MNDRPLLERRGVRWGLFFGLWTALGLFDAVQTWGLVRLLGSPLTPREVFSLALAEWYLWAPLAWLLLRIGRRFPCEPGRWRSRLALLLAVSAAFAALKVALDFPVEVLLRVNYSESLRDKTRFEFFQVLFMDHFLVYLFICGAVLGIGHALDYHRKYRERELRASHLEAQLARAQLQVLKMQLHPHFLFNTLNAVSALLHKDVELADRMIARLGDLLRLTLENVGTQEVCLQQELEFVALYLEIERARLGPRLALHLDIDPDARHACVPNLILQPLVENAVRHGVAPYARAGRIDIAARRAGALLRLQVRDDGPGLPRGGAFREGVGLANTRARLQQLYGPAHGFEMAGDGGRGLAVTLTLPFRDSPEEDPGPTEAGDEDPRPDRG